MPPPRFAASKDANHGEIVKALIRVGASVEDLSAVGGGVPDLLVGFRGRCYLLEIKTERGRLNKIQSDWHRLWNGHVAVVRSVDEALAVLWAKGPGVGDAAR